MKKKIQELAPLLADHFIDSEIDPKTANINVDLVESNSTRLRRYYKYLGVFHDSRVITTGIEKNTFNITLNDFATHVFSDVVIDKNGLDIDHDRLVFPVRLEFETAAITFCQVEEDGFLKKIDPVSFDEYLDEQIIAFGTDTIQICLAVWQDGRDDEPGNPILILMTVTNIEVYEMQDIAWRDIFGKIHDPYYYYFKQQRESGRYLSDQSNCYELYEEYEERNK